jgi:UDP-N-acetylmuramyl pentapeptide synthase
LAIVTNTLDAHIGEFGGFNNLVKAKGEIYSSYSKNIIILLSASCVFSTTKVGKLDSTFLLTSSATAPIFCACFTIT